MSTRQIVTDDLTGEDLSGTDGVHRKVNVAGKSLEVDLSDASLTALTDALTGNGSAALYKLLALAHDGTGKARGSRSRTASASSPRKSGGESTQARTWARETPNGQRWAKANPDVNVGTESSRGRADARLIEAWRADTTGASGNAVTPPATVPATPESAKSGKPGTAA